MTLMPRKKTSQDEGQTQSDRFIEAARAAGASEDEAVFDANLKKIVKAKTAVFPDSGKKAKSKSAASDRPGS